MRGKRTLSVVLSTALSLGLLVNARSALADDDRDADSGGAHSVLGQHRDRDRLGWYVPDYARLQTGGYLGRFGAGFGYAAFDDRLNVSLFYGYTPALEAGDSVHAGKLSLAFRPVELGRGQFRLVPAYVGAGLLYAFGGKFFTRLPARYRRIDTRYYPPTAVHWMVELGLEADYVPSRGPIERHGLYYEVVTLDTYIASWFENSNHVRVIDTLASTVGYRMAF